MEGALSPYNNGYWTWDDATNSLQFVSSEVLVGTSTSTLNTFVSKSTAKHGHVMGQVKFREVQDKLNKIIFRRYVQRKVKPSEPDVVTIQDVKDVALYLASPKDLSLEFIVYFHIPLMDRFLRALILYFQYFIDIWEYNLNRREEKSRKLWQPIVTELENVVRDDLADLRSMVCREYLRLIGGSEEASQFHHMKDKNNSLSDKDRKLFETLLCIASRVVWIALHRKHLNLIELEIHRVFRSASFNTYQHRRQVSSLMRTPSEDRVLNGAANRFERKLLQRSPLVKEILFGQQDYRMLGIGMKNFEPSDERLQYLEAAYAAPEELLLNMGITVGILGIPRDEYDPVLLPRERTTKTYTKAPIEVPSFHIPPPTDHNGCKVPNEFPSAPCKYNETVQTKVARTKQLCMWKRTIKKMTDQCLGYECMLAKDQRSIFGAPTKSKTKVEK